MCLSRWAEHRCSRYIRARVLLVTAPLSLPEVSPFRSLVMWHINKISYRIGCQAQSD